MGAALASLTLNISPISSEEYSIVSECLIVLGTFNKATIEVSEEKMSVWLKGHTLACCIELLPHSKS